MLEAEEWYVTLANSGYFLAGHGYGPLRVAIVHRFLFAL
jgi:hypothetical protein